MAGDGQAGDGDVGSGDAELGIESVEYGMARKG